MTIWSACVCCCFGAGVPHVYTVLQGVHVCSFLRLGSLHVAEYRSDHPLPKGTTGRRPTAWTNPLGVAHTGSRASALPRCAWDTSVALRTWCQASTCVPARGALKRHRLATRWHTLALNDLVFTGLATRWRALASALLQVRVLPGSVRFAVLRHQPFKMFRKNLDGPRVLPECLPYQIPNASPTVHPNFTIPPFDVQQTTGEWSCKPAPPANATC